MKGLLLLTLISSLTLTTCSEDHATFNNDLFSHIAETEKIVTIYDQSIQEAFETDEFNTIPDLSHKAVVAATRKLEAVKDLEASKSVLELKTAGVSYLEALIAMIKAEEVYSFYSSSLTLDDVKLMDKKNIQARKDLQEKHEFLLKCQEEVKLKSVK